MRIMVQKMRQEFLIIYVEIDSEEAQGSRRETPRLPSGDVTARGRPASPPTGQCVPAQQCSPAPPAARGPPPDSQAANKLFSDHMTAN